MAKDHVTMKDILKNIRKMGVDTVEFRNKEGTESIDINESIEKGRIVTLGDDNKNEK